MRRTLAALCLVLALVATVESVATAEPARREAQPAARLAYGAPRRTTLDARRAWRVLASALRWGGQYTAVTGERVTIFLSDTYAQDPALPQRWADFLARLVHGTELATVTVYLAPLIEVQRICGFRALACYSPSERLIVTPGENPALDLTAEATLTHEYGHHVAASRSNAPWRAVDYGTKRWATYLGVCPRSESGEFSPGSEQASLYALNPGEGFAEAYRVLNERRAGIVESPWDIVSHAFYPDPTALALVEQDVTQPWAGPSTTRRAAPISARAPRAAHTVATPFDGTLRVTVRAPARARVAVELYAGGTRVGRATVRRGRSATATATVCGQRAFRVVVRRLDGAGTARLAISRP